MNRPPKKWFYHHLKLAKQEKRITNPAAFVGWLWYHHLTPEQKIKHLTKKDLRRELLKYYTLGHGSACEEKAETTYGAKMKKKKKARKAKRRLSKKQLKALQRGRKVLKHLRTGREISEPKEPIIIKTGGLGMSKRKGKGKRVKHIVYGFEGAGFEGRKRRGKGKRGRGGRFLGFDGGGINFMNVITDVAGLLGGALLGGQISKMLPVKNNLVKALIPTAAGIAGNTYRPIARQRFLQRASLGLLLVGAANVVKNFWPNAPLLQGETAEDLAAQIDNLPDEERAVLGLLPARETVRGEDGAAEEESDTYGAMPASETAGEEGAEEEELQSGEPMNLSPASM